MVSIIDRLLVVAPRLSILLDVKLLHVSQSEQPLIIRQAANFHENCHDTTRGSAVLSKDHIITLN